MHFAWYHLILDMSFRARKTKMKEPLVAVAFEVRYNDKLGQDRSSNARIAVAARCV